MIKKLKELEEEYNQLEEDIKLILDAWCACLNTSENYNYNHTSYGLKSIFDFQNKSLNREVDVSHNQFKYALYKNGFEPDDEADDFWCFKISEEQKFTWI